MPQVALAHGHLLQADELRNAVDRARRLARERLSVARLVADDREPLRAPVVHPVRGRERLLVERAVQEVRVTDMRARASAPFAVVTRNGIPAPSTTGTSRGRRAVARAADDPGDAVVRERPRRARTGLRRAGVVQNLELDLAAEDAAVVVDLRPPRARRPRRDRRPRGSPVGASTPIVSFPLPPSPTSVHASRAAPAATTTAAAATTRRPLQPPVKSKTVARPAGRRERDGPRRPTGPRLTCRRRSSRSSAGRRP